MPLEIGAAGERSLATADAVVRKAGFFSRLFGRGRPSATAAPDAPSYRIPPPAPVGSVIDVDVRALRTRQLFVEGKAGPDGGFRVFGHYSEEVSERFGKASIPEVYWVDWVEGEEPFWAILDGNHRTVDAWTRGQRRIKARVAALSRERAQSSLWGDKPYVPFGRTQLWDEDDFLGHLEERFPLRKARGGALGERLWAEASALEARRGGASDDAAPGLLALLRRSSGVPLPAKVRGRMEGWLGADLTGVRVHDDAVAHQAAEQLEAEAFAVGQDVFFARGAYVPDAPAGLGLIAHELTHVLQALGGAPLLADGPSAPPGARPGVYLHAAEEALERQAEWNERAVRRAAATGSDPLDLIGLRGRRGGLRSSPTSAGRPRRSPADPRREVPAPVADGPEVSQALALFREALPYLGAGAEIAVGLIPVVGDLYDLLCGLVGKALIPWQDLDVYERILCFAGVVPIPFVAGPILRRGKRALQWVLSRSRAVQILAHLMEAGTAFVRRNLGRLRDWAAGLAGPTARRASDFARDALARIDPRKAARALRNRRRFLTDPAFAKKVVARYYASGQLPTGLTARRVYRIDNRPDVPEGFLPNPTKSYQTGQSFVHFSASKDWGVQKYFPYVKRFEYDPEVHIPGRRAVVGESTFYEVDVVGIRASEMDELGLEGFHSTNYPKFEDVVLTPYAPPQAIVSKRRVRVTAEVVEVPKLPDEHPYWDDSGYRDFPGGKDGWNDPGLPVSFYDLRLEEAAELPTPSTHAWSHGTRLAPEAKAARAAARALRMDLEELLSVAAQPVSGKARGSFTAAGRALQKHQPRPGGKRRFDVFPVLPKGRASPRHFNEEGLAIVREILSHPQKTVELHTSRWGYDVVDFIHPDGRAVRYTADGERFVGLRNPSEVGDRLAREGLLARSAIAGTLGEQLAAGAELRLAQVGVEPGGELDASFAATLRRSASTALPAGVRARMEGILGSDFSSVRVHRDEAAHRAASSIGARAFTLGTDVFFRRGAYDPGTAEGLALLAHELTHVAQNTGGAHTVRRSEDELTRDAWWARHAVGAYTVTRGLLTFYFGGGLEGLADVPEETIERTYAVLQGRRAVGPTDIYLAAREVTGSDEEAVEAALGVALRHAHDLPLLPLEGIDPEAPRFDKYKHFFSCAVLATRGNATGAEWVGWLKEQSDRYLGGGHYDPLDVVANDLGARWARDLLRGRLRRVTQPAGPQRRGLVLGGHDRFEQQAEANERAVREAVRSGALLPGSLEAATQGLVAAMGPDLRVSRRQAVARTREVLRRAVASDRSGHTALRLQQFAEAMDAGGGAAVLRRKADVRRAVDESARPEDAAVEAEVLAAESIPSGDEALSRWPFLRRIVGFLRDAFGGVTGTIADIVVSILPVIGNVYTVCCGLIGRQIIGWRPLGLVARLLSFASVVPLPGMGLLRRAGGVAQRFLGRTRWLRRGLTWAARQYKRFVPRVLNAVRGLWDRVVRFAGRIAQSATRFLERHTQKAFGWIRTKAGARAARLGQLEREFGELVQGKLDELARTTGRSPEELLEEALAGARADMDELLAGALPGYRFRMHRATEAVESSGHELLEWSTRQYHETLLPGRAPGGLTRRGYLDYGRLPAGAGGGAALASDSAIYSLRAEGPSGVANDLALLVGHANTAAVHEFGHVLQYAYFQKVLRRLGAGLEHREVALLQDYLETVQKPAMESMAYLFATPGIGNSLRQRLVGNFVETASANLRAGNFGRWGLSLPVVESLRSSFVLGAGSGLLGTLLEFLAGGAVTGGIALPLGAAGAVLGLVKALKVMRRARPGEDPFADFSHALGRRPLSRSLARALEELDKPGFGLEHTVRQRLESFLGEDLGHVRVHTGLAAERLSEAVSADAFTLREHVFLGGGHDLDRPEGLGLLAHEATHAVQHARGQLAGPASPGRTEALEREAYAREQAVVARALPRPATPPPAPERVLREAPPTTDDVPHTSPRRLEGPVLAADANRRRTKADVVQQIMSDFHVRHMTREEFVEELRERLLDLIHDETELENERRETLAWNYHLPLA
ncbi:MAG: DUF4157 domain-containing protein [Planctomycetota bacterium]|nr:MAG: DUF4157 domain-containing protein [Planctomycetota bacterium]